MIRSTMELTKETSSAIQPASAVHAVGEVEDHAAHGRAVLRQVVAGHDRERSGVGGVAHGEARDQPPGHAGDWRGGACDDRLDVRADLRMVDVQPAVVPAQVRRLGDGGVTTSWHRPRKDSSQEFWSVPR